MNTLAQPLPTVNHFLQVRPFNTFTDGDRPTVDGYYIERVDNERRLCWAYAWQNGHRYPSPFAALDAARRMSRDYGVPVLASKSLRDAYYSQAVA